MYLFMKIVFYCDMTLYSHLHRSWY